MFGLMGTRNIALLEWIRSTEEGEATAAAKAAGTSVGYLKQVAYGNKRPSGEKASAIERATGISRITFRPDDWHLIWPELKERISAS